MTASISWNTVHLVPPTPFSQDGRQVDVDTLATLVESLINKGIQVVIPAAGTGEFHSLSVSEASVCIQSVAQICRGRAKVLAPVGLGLEHALATGEIALKSGVDGILVMPPIHPYLSDTGVQLYFETIAHELRTKIWVYKRGPYPSNECLKTLVDKNVVCGIKYAVNDMNSVADFIESIDSRCHVVCGTAERNAPFFHLAGARGFTSGLATLFPELSLKLHHHLTNSDYEKAMQIRAVLSPFERFRSKFSDALNISTIKAGMQIIGIPVGPVRPPNRPLSHDEFQDLEKIIAEILKFETTD